MIHENSPGSLKMTKRQIYHDQHRAAAAAVIESEKLLNEMMQMTDYREGVAAFLEKRKPRWLGE
jgi:enoyl-CoA hydratase/carnithine racemase